MADKKPAKKVEKKPKKPELTVRDRMSTQPKTKTKARIRKSVKTAGTPLRFVSRFFKKIAKFKIFNNKVARAIGRVLWPKFVREAISELKLVTWPNRRDTIKMTFAVFIFAIVFSSLIGIIDFGLSKLFERFIVN